MQITSLSGLPTPNLMGLMGGMVGEYQSHAASDFPETDGFERAVGTESTASSAAWGLTPFFGENPVAWVKQGVATMESSLDPVWQGWAQFVGMVYNLTSTQVTGAAIFGIAAGSLWGLYATHIEKSEVCFVRELKKLERDLGAPRLFDLVARRHSSIRNLDELKLTLQAYELATARLKIYRSERADIHDWLASPKGRGSNEGVITMRTTYGRIARILESQIRSFFIRLLVTNTDDSPLDQKDRFIRDYGEFIRVTSYETASNAHYPFRQEMGWLMRRYEGYRQELHPE